MKIKFNNNVFYVLVFFVEVLFSLLSCLFHLFSQLVLFMILVVITTVIFNIFLNFNHKRYLSIVIALLLAASILFSILNQTYGLISIGTYIFPILGALVLVTVFVPQMKKATMVLESNYSIGMSKLWESIDISDNILESYPEDKDALYFKAYALHFLEKHDEQLALLDKIIEKKPKKAIKVITLNLKVFALLKLRKYDEAEESIESILKEDPKNVDTIFCKAYLLSKLGYKQESIEYYKDSLELINKELLKYKKSTIKKIRFPNNLWNLELSGIWAKKGDIHYKLKQYNESLECFNEVLKLNSEFFLVWNNKSFLLAKLGQYYEALKCVDKSLELYPSAEALCSKGYVLAESGKPKEALKYYQKAIEINSLDEEKYYHKGRAHQELQQYTESLNCYNKTLELNPNCEAAKKAKDKLLKLMEN